MKLLKKYLFIAGIFTVFLLAPLSVQIQTKAPVNPVNIDFTQNKINTNLVKITILTANANEQTVVGQNGLMDCGWYDMPCHGINFLYVIFVNVGNILVGLSAKFMDFFLSHSLQSSSYNSSDFIKQGWEILRDVTNIVFIFALLYIAFQMVLGIGKGEAKKYLIKIILITLTINFSLFFSYTIIDTSNIFAHVFYNKINQDDVKFNSISNTGITGDIEGKSVSLAIANKINPQKLFNGPYTTQGSRMLLTIIAGIINGAMIYVFLSVAFLFLGRTIGLWIAALLSPLAFASLTIPKMKNMQYIGFENWFKSLLQMAFMAPIFLFILYLAVQFMNIYTIGGNPSTLQNMLDILLPMAMIVVLLLTAKKIANKMSGDFAGTISGFVGKIAGGVVGVGAMAITGGAAAAAGAGGMLTSAVGHGAKKFGGKKAAAWGERTVKRGKQMRSMKVMDVTKIPGFKKVLPGELKSTSDFFSKRLAGTSMRGTENKMKLGAMELKEKTQDVVSGKGFEEEEAKFELKKKGYDNEQEKRKDGGAASWQEKIIKEEEQADLKNAKDKAKTAKSKAELEHGGKISETTRKLEQEDIKLSSNQEFKDLSSTIEEQSKKQMDLQKKLTKKEKELKDLPIGLQNQEKRNSFVKEIKEAEKEIKVTTNKIKDAHLKQKDFSKDRDLAETNVEEAKSTMEKAGGVAEAKSRKESAEKLVEKNNSLEKQRTARKIIGDKGLKSKEEKLIEKLVEKLKEEEK